MKAKINFKLWVLCAILSAMLIAPTLGQAKEDEGAKFKERFTQMIKSLKLAPEKEKSVLDVQDKYAKERKSIIDGMKKANTDLEAALKATPPDEAKIKELIGTITAGQDKLFATFKNQRDEEMALMTTVEQGKYLLAMGKWREEMAKKMKESAQKKK